MPEYTTLTGTLVHSDTILGPKAGQPRTADSVTQGLQTAINNDYAAAHGYLKVKTLGVIEGAAVSTFTDITEPFVWAERIGKSTSLHFKNGLVWQKKTVLFTQVDRGLTVTFSRGSPASVFFQWRADAEYHNVEFTFICSGTWFLVSMQTNGASTRIINASTLLLSDPPRYEFESYSTDTYGASVDFDGAHVIGQIYSDLTIKLTESSPRQGTVHRFTAEQINGGASLIITNASDSVVASIPAIGHNLFGPTIEVIYDTVYGGSGWSMKSFSEGQRSARISTPSHTSTSVTVNPALNSYISVQGTISTLNTYTILDGTRSGQEIVITFPLISSPGSATVNFNDGDTIVFTSSVTPHRVFKAIWSGGSENEWHPVSTR